MLIPRFSLRRLLVFVTASGMVAFVAARAVAGEAWGIAVSVACGALLLTGAIHAVVFLVAHGFAQAGSSRKPRATSPFATHLPPPQILAPQDPD